MKYVEQAELLENKAIIPEIWKMVVYSPQIAAAAVPGQFVQVHVSGGRAFLRRPFGIADADISTGTITLIYRIAGTGTREMQQLQAGQFISTEGPLGNGVFSLTPGSVLLAGGGVGLAPLIFLAKNLENPTVLVAGKTKKEVFWTKFFEPFTDSIYVTTDDGSCGIKGFAAAAVPVILQERLIDRIAVCGPTAMMKTVAAAALKRGIACEVSMEKRMACGIGVCLGCTFAARQSGRRLKVCADGPVFPAEEVF